MSSVADGSSDKSIVISEAVLSVSHQWRDKTGIELFPESGKPCMLSELAVPAQ